MRSSDNSYICMYMCIYLSMFLCVTVYSVNVNFNGKAGHIKITEACTMVCIVVAAT